MFFCQETLITGSNCKDVGHETWDSKGTRGGIKANITWRGAATKMTFCRQGWYAIATSPCCQFHVIPIQVQSSFFVLFWVTSFRGTRIHKPWSFKDRNCFIGLKLSAAVVLGAR